MCLWNGFIAAAPGHPFLARALEILINQVRNRFTTIDISATYCPTPELSVVYRYDTLFATGPCMLGSAVNSALGRPLQTAFTAGHLITNTTTPGRVIFLHQDKQDMGAQRYSDPTRNAIVFATGFDGLEDKTNKERKLGGFLGKHYSNHQKHTGAFATRGVYKDRRKANENIRIVIDSTTADEKWVATTTDPPVKTRKVTPRFPRKKRHFVI
jgi:hypothetical protein